MLAALFANVNPVGALFLLAAFVLGVIVLTRDLVVGLAVLAVVIAVAVLIA